MKKIKLTKGKTALVDDEDFAEINKMKWHSVSPNKNNLFYAYSRIYKEGKSLAIVCMHRHILGLKKGQKIVVDHIDGDGLNNQKNNLRFCTNKQNLVNRKTGKLAKTTSKYKGVFKNTSFNKYPWFSQIKVDERVIYLGSFQKEEDAARTFDKASIVAHGEFAKLNFEDSKTILLNEISQDYKKRQALPTQGLCLE